MQHQAIPTAKEQLWLASSTEADGELLVCQDSEEFLGIKKSWSSLLQWRGMMSL